MRSRITFTLLSVLLIAGLSGAVPGPSRAEGYEALKGVDAVKIIFDFRNAKPQSVLVYLKLIQQTYKDKAITTISPKPDFVVVFMGGAVKLVSKDRKGFSSKEEKMLDEIASLIEGMSKDGIRLEICDYAVKFFGLDPKATVPGIQHVENGWIASFGYQAQGYALIPVY